MARWLLILLIWLLQATLILLLVSEGWVEREFNHERALVISQFGRARANALSESTDRHYQRWFVDTGLVKRSYSDLLPDPTIPQKGTENLAPWAFRWVEQRLDAFWWLSYQAVYRLLLLRIWTPYVGCAVLAAVIEGLVRRQIKRARQGYASSDRLVMARTSLLVLILVPLFYLSLPIAVPPVLLPLGGACLALASALYTANIQHRI